MNRSLLILAVSVLSAGCLDFDAAHGDCYASGRCKETDAAAPAVVSTVPANRATDVAPTTQVTIAFDKAMQPATVVASLIPQVDLVAPQWNADNTEVTFTPNAQLQFSTQYTLRVSGTAQDNGKLEATNVASFTIRAPPRGPALIASSPANQTNLVPLDAGLMLQFDLPVDSTSFSAVTNPPVLLGLADWSTDRTRATYPTAAPYEENKTYSVTLSGKGIDGLDLSPPLSFTFQTVTDVTAPNVQTVSPANGALNVALSTTPSITFSEAMNSASVFAALSTSPADAGCSWTLEPTEKKVLSCVHANPLAADAGYTISLSTAAADLAGNQLAAPYSFGFVTGPVPDVTAPTLVSSLPADGANGVDPQGLVKLTFSEPMDPVLTEAAITVTSPASTTPINFAWTNNNSVVTFSLNPLPPHTSTVGWRVATTAKDASGNALAATATGSFSTWRQLTTTLTSVTSLDGYLWRQRSSGSTSLYTTETTAMLQLGDASISRLYYAFDMTPLFNAGALSIQSAVFSTYEDSETYYPNSSWGIYGGYWGSLIVENVEYGTSLDVGDWAAGPVLVNSQTFATLSNQYFSTTTPHSAELLPWFRQQWTEWDGNAGSAERYAQFRVRMSSEAITGGSGTVYGRVFYRTGESTNSVKTSIAVTYFAP